MFLDENGDVQQNLTVLAFSDDTGEKPALFQNSCKDFHCKEDRLM